MRSREFIFEKVSKTSLQPPPNEAPVQSGGDSLQGLKAVIASKIKDLPPNEKTQKILQEIEDLLAHVNAGGRKGHIGSELDAIDDRDVQKARSLLAKYVLSLDMSPQQRTDLFTRWKNDELVNIDVLLSVGKHSIPEIINGYGNGKNPAIKELVDDLAQVAALGQGKGEFLLSVLSKRITKLSKGDLGIDGKRIEVKTQDVGGGRFFDQEVRPDAAFSRLADSFLKIWPAKVGAKVAASGVKLIDMINIGDALPPNEKEKYYKEVTKLLKSIFPGMKVKTIVNGMKVGNIGAAKQAYAVTNLDYYRSIKTDDSGILFIDISKPIAEFVFFTNAQELAQGGLRLHADTVYPASKDPRNAYPQMRIITTKAAHSSAESPTLAVNTPVPNTKKPTAPPVQPAPNVRQNTISPPPKI